VTAAGAMTVTRSTNGLLTGTTLGTVPETFGYNAYGEVTSHGVYPLHEAASCRDRMFERMLAG